jgi:hypothetical protein
LCGQLLVARWQVALHIVRALSSLIKCWMSCDLQLAASLERLSGSGNGAALYARYVATNCHPEAPRRISVHRRTLWHRPYTQSLCRDPRSFADSG